MAKAINLTLVTTTNPIIDSGFNGATISKWTLSKNSEVKNKTASQ
jgi:hypothetical protein